MKLKLNKTYFGLMGVTLVLMTGFQNCQKEVSFSSSSNEEGTIPLPFRVEYKRTNFTMTEAKSKVDVLVVIDNSGSMGFEQQSMANRFSSFLDQLTGVDWQIGIITTDVENLSQATSDGKLLDFNGSGKYLIKSSENLAASKTLFANTIRRSESGSGNEQGLKASIRALERAENPLDNNHVLIREGAALSIIVITDADETGPTRPENLLNLISSKYAGKSFKFHSLVVKTDDLVCLHDRTAFLNQNGGTSYNQNEFFGASYETLSTRTTGVIGNVCSSNYGDQLSTIGHSTAQQTRQITLECAPMDQDHDGIVDIEIKNADTQAVISGYTVSGPLVNFNNDLPAGNYVAGYSCELH